MNLWIYPLCSSLLILILQLNLHKQFKTLVKHDTGLIPVGAIRLYHTQRYRGDPSIFDAQEVIYTKIPVKYNL